MEPAGMMNTEATPNQSRAQHARGAPTLAEEEVFLNISTDIVWHD
jgi:hypothetical protein